MSASRYRGVVGLALDRQRATLQSPYHLAAAHRRPHRARHQRYQLATHVTHSIAPFTTAAERPTSLHCNPYREVRLKLPFECRSGTTVK